VIVAVIAMHVVQVAVDQVIRVVAVRYGLMAAARPMLVLLRVPPAIVLRSTPTRVGGTHVHRVFLDVGGAEMVQVAVVQVIDVPVMLDASMPTLGTVLVVVAGVVGLCVTHRGNLLYRKYRGKAGTMLASRPLLDLIDRAHSRT
jgi:hypothetical protein